MYAHYVIFLQDDLVLGVQAGRSEILIFFSPDLHLNKQTMAIPWSTLYIDEMFLDVCNIFLNGE